MEIVWHSVGWTETHDGKPQCTYMTADEEGKHGKFLVRQYGDYHWMAINLSLPKFGVGQILAEGQSDTDCFKKATEQIETLLGWK